MLTTTPVFEPALSIVPMTASESMNSARPSLNEARTKIVATVGPACSSIETLSELVKNGVDIFRINAAHGKTADFEATLAKIKEVRERTGTPVGVLLDLGNHPL